MTAISLRRSGGFPARSDALLPDIRIAPGFDQRGQIESQVTATIKVRLSPQIGSPTASPRDYHPGLLEARDNATPLGTCCSLVLVVRVATNVARTRRHRDPAR